MHIKFLQNVSFCFTWLTLVATYWGVHHGGLKIPLWSENWGGVAIKIKCSYSSWGHNMNVALKEKRQAVDEVTLPCISCPWAYRVKECGVDDLSQSCRWLAAFPQRVRTSSCSEWAVLCWFHFPWDEGVGSSSMLGGGRPVVIIIIIIRIGKSTLWWQMTIHSSLLFSGQC